MGSRHPLFPESEEEAAGIDKEAFVEECVRAVETLDFPALFKKRPKISTFMEAYVLARGLPIMMQRRPRTRDAADEEDFDDDAFHCLLLPSEDFLNAWTPTSHMEAALMLDVFTADGGPQDALWAIPGAVEDYLLGLSTETPLLDVASEMLTDFSKMLSLPAATNLQSGAA